MRSFECVIIGFTEKFDEVFLETIFYIGFGYMCDRTKKSVFTNLECMQKNGREHGL